MDELRGSMSKQQRSLSYSAVQSAISATSSSSLSSSSSLPSASDPSAQHQAPSSAVSSAPVAVAAEAALSPASSRRSVFAGGDYSPNATPVPARRIPKTSASASASSSDPVDPPTTTAPSKLLQAALSASNVGRVPKSPSSAFVEALRRAQQEGHEPIIVSPHATSRQTAQSTQRTDEFTSAPPHSPTQTASSATVRQSPLARKSLPLMPGMLASPAAGSTQSNVTNDDFEIEETEFLLADQEPIDLLDTSFVEDLTTVMKPVGLSSSASSSSSSLENSAMQSPIGSPQFLRNRPVLKSSTPLKNTFSLSNQLLDEKDSDDGVIKTTEGDSAATMQIKQFSLGVAFDQRNEQSSTVAAPTGSMDQPPSHQTPASARTGNSLSEFDPLVTIPKDWMMQFDSPVTGGTRPPLPPSSAAHAVSTPPPSLLDLTAPLVTPNSQVKYTQRDMDEQRRRLQHTFDKEFDVAQLEIQELTLSAQSLRRENQQMKETLMQWEQAVKMMITEKDKERQHKQAEIDGLHDQILKLSEERDTAKRESDQVSLRYKQLRIDIDEKQRAQISQLEESVSAAHNRFDLLRKHAESKLEEANIEIARVRAGYEKELTALRAKLSRVEVQMQALDRNLQAKVQENAELTKICDGLVQQMEMSG
eukprot:jgi/Hompol1/5718/HPOL_002035-RA